MRNALHLLGLLSVIALPTSAVAARPPSPAASAMAGAHSFVATGPATAADLRRLREALAKLPGIVKVETRATPDGATVTIEGDGSTTESLFAAAAKSVGFVLRPAPTRSFVASGPAGESNLRRLRETIGKVAGVEKVEVGPGAHGAALRISGVATTADLTQAGASAGFALQPLGAYVAAGSSTAADLGRLRAALGKVAGVKQIELQGLDGGATLLIYGDPRESPLTEAAKAAGFKLWPLGDVRAPLEFQIRGRAGADARHELPEALQSVDGIGAIEIRGASDGPRLIVTGGRARGESIVAAAAAAGFELAPVENVSLPSLAPEAGRNTPPDYDKRVLGEETRVGDMAPDFTLVAPDETTKIRLSDYRGKKPVVLVFGSCT